METKIGFYQFTTPAEYLSAHGLTRQRPYRYFDWKQFEIKQLPIHQTIPIENTRYLTLDADSDELRIDTGDLRGYSLYYPDREKRFYLQVGMYEPEAIPYTCYFEYYTKATDRKTRKYLEGIGANPNEWHPDLGIAADFIPFGLWYLQYQGHQIRHVICRWMKDERNWNEYHEKRKSGFSHHDAAGNTWSGAHMIQNGFPIIAQNPMYFDANKGTVLEILFSKSEL